MFTLPALRARSLLSPRNWEGKAAAQVPALPPHPRVAATVSRLPHVKVIIIITCQLLVFWLLARDYSFGNGLGATDSEKHYIQPP